MLESGIRIHSLQREAERADRVSRAGGAAAAGAGDGEERAQLPHPVDRPRPRPDLILHEKQKKMSLVTEEIRAKATEVYNDELANKYYKKMLKWLDAELDSPPDNEELMRKDSACVAEAALKHYNEKEGTKYVFDEPFLCRC
ncbi:unnamed protein product, partial [Linum tenue]